MTPDQSGLNLGVIIVTPEKFMAGNIDCLLRQTRLSAHLVMGGSGSQFHCEVQVAGRQCLRPLWCREQATFALSRRLGQRGPNAQAGSPQVRPPESAALLEKSPSLVLVFLGKICLREFI